jgi:hypothetical protein
MPAIRFSPFFALIRIVTKIYHAFNNRYHPKKK